MTKLIAIIAAALAMTACAAPDATRLRVQAGMLQGTEQGGVRRFLSVPYAAPPIGALRWRIPQPPQPWRGVRDAVSFGPSCMQNQSPDGWGPWTGEYSPQGAVSEDCLTLSVWTPARTQDELLPVMVWIPGGGFTDGGEATPAYDAEALARRGIVVVSINYRVAAFGLLAHPALATAGEGNGNFPMHDAIAALRWVHDNINAFGGDPARVTIAGQSAGGAIVYALLDAPDGAGLFTQAIIQSFPPGSHRFADRTTQEQASVAFAATLGAATAEALRAAPVEAVLAASDEANLDLYVDGVVISDPLGASLPYLNDVPTLIGITADETSFMRHDMGAYRETAARYGDGFQRLYPASNDAEAREAELRADRDATLVALQRWSAARAHSSHGLLYLYLWTHSLPGPDAERYRAFHSSEVPYVFGSFSTAPQRAFTDEDRAISDRMMRYWASFVATGDPNVEGLPAWPHANGEEGVVMELGDAFAPMTPLPSATTAFFNAYCERGGDYAF